MNDAPVELERGEFAISTDRARIDPDAALALLHTTHWGGGMERPVLARAIENSISLAEAYRGQGLR